MTIKLTRVLFALVIFAFAGCNSDSAQTKKFTAANLRKLRWIEGTWRGTGDNVKPFFERYRFEGDSLLLIDSFEDETLAKVTDASRYELKDGEFGGVSEGYRYVAISLDDRAIEFGPAVKVKNGFRWERGDSKDVWIATIILPASGNKPVSQRVYKMERWPKP